MKDNCKDEELLSLFEGTAFDPITKLYSVSGNAKLMYRFFEELKGSPSFVKKDEKDRTYMSIKIGKIADHLNLSKDITSRILKELSIAGLVIAYRPAVGKPYRIYLKDNEPMDDYMV